jgi:Ankyrin repeat
MDEFSEFRDAFKEDTCAKLRSLLLQRGLDANCAHPTKGWSPLFFLVFFRNSGHRLRETPETLFEAVRLLIDHGAGDFQRIIRPLLAGGKANPQLLEFLIEKGATVGIPEVQMALACGGPAEIAVVGKHCGVREMSTSTVLNAYLADDILDNDGRQCSEFEGMAAKITALINCGADPNVKDSVGFTPLHYAASRPLAKARYLTARTERVEERVAATRVLLDRGADPDATTAGLKTSLDLATDGCKEVGELIMRYTSGSSSNANTNRHGGKAAGVQVKMDQVLGELRSLRRWVLLQIALCLFVFLAPWAASARAFLCEKRTDNPTADSEAMTNFLEFLCS